MVIIWKTSLPPPTGWNFSLVPIRIPMNAAQRRIKTCACVSIILQTYIHNVAAAICDRCRRFFGAYNQNGTLEKIDFFFLFKIASETSHCRDFVSRFSWPRPKRYALHTCIRYRARVTKEFAAWVVCPERCFVIFSFFFFRTFRWRETTINAYTLICTHMNTRLLCGPHCLDNPRRAAVWSGIFVARNHRLRRLLTFSTGRPEIIETSNKSNDYYKI